MQSFRAIPGPRGLPLIGNVLSFSALGRHSFERLHLAKRENYIRYGRIYKERLGPGVAVVQVFDPDDVRAVFRADGRFPTRPPLPITVVASKRDGLSLGLGSLNGSAWYNLRTAVQRLLMHPRAASVYLPAQNQVADDFLHMIQTHMDAKGQVANFPEMLLKYTMESIGTVCFDTRLGCLSDKYKEGSSADLMLTSTANVLEAVQHTTFDFPWYAFLNTKLYQQFVESKKTCNRTALSYIEAASQRQNAETSLAPNFLRSLVKTDKLSREDITSITTDLFTAGIDSTAYALSFVLYNLARNQDKQMKLAREIATELPPGSPVTSTTIDKLTYMKACVKESFRLNFPIEGGTTRILQKNTCLSGYEVKKGTMVALNNQTMCLLDEYFKEPESYLPERWIKNSGETAPHPFIMLPFGHGLRMCIGRRFAEQEIYLALIKILQHFEIGYFHGEIGMLNRVFTMPDKPLKLTFQRR